ncbi:MAG: hypothetical protein K2F99_00200 [Muribaculaceae bacterium]|nr:hypothetical protein [Muribaculaceae bacterium]
MNLLLRTAIIAAAKRRREEHDTRTPKDIDDEIESIGLMGVCLLIGVIIFSIITTYVACS